MVTCVGIKKSCDAFTWNCAIKDKLKKTRIVRLYSVQQVIDYENATIFADTQIEKKNMLFKHNSSDIVLRGKVRKQILIVEVVIANLNDLNTLETIKQGHMTSPLALGLELEYRSKANMLQYVVKWGNNY